MKGQRKARGQKAVAAGILGILDGTKTAEEVLQDPAIVAVIGTPEEVEVAAVGVEVIREEITPKRKPTPKERATGPRVIPGTGIVVDESDKVVGVDEEIVQKIEEKNMTVKADAREGGQGPKSHGPGGPHREPGADPDAGQVGRAASGRRRRPVRGEGGGGHARLLPSAKEMKVAKATAVKAWKTQEARTQHPPVDAARRAKGIKVEELPEDLGRGRRSPGRPPRDPRVRGQQPR